MRKFLFLLLYICYSMPLSAQLAYNEKAPSIVVDSYLYGVKSKSGLPTFVDFFVEGASHNLAELSALNIMAKKYASHFNFLVITKSNGIPTTRFFDSISEPIYYSVVYDSFGTTFKNYNVRYLPFSVIIDKNGKFVWQGKSTLLTDEIIKRYIE